MHRFLKIIQGAHPVVMGNKRVFSEINILTCTGPEQFNIPGMVRRIILFAGGWGVRGLFYLVNLIIIILECYDNELQQYTIAIQFKSASVSVFLSSSFFFYFFISPILYFTLDSKGSNLVRYIAITKVFLRHTLVEFLVVSDSFPKYDIVIYLHQCLSLFFLSLVH